MSQGEKRCMPLISAVCRDKGIFEVQGQPGLHGDIHFMKGNLSIT